MTNKILFISDLDGTLLNGETKISDTTVEILNRLIDDEKILFTVATARTPATVVPLLSRVHTNLPLIVMTGAAMWMPGSTYAHTNTIDTNTVDRIVDICHSCGINPFVYSQQDDTLAVFHAPQMTPIEEKFVAERRNSPFKHFFLKDELQSTDGVLIFATAKWDSVSEAQRLISEGVECESCCYHDIYSPEYGLLEIFAPGTSKASAIERLAASLDVDKTVVFGDNLNDISMFNVADIAVAVDNAYPEVKEAATVTIGNNNQDSVAHWIEENYNKI